VTSFFEEPPQQPRERHVPPPWSQPPANELGVAVPLRAVLARTADVAIVADSLVAYSTGLTFRIAGRARPGSEIDLDTFAHAVHGHHRGGREAMAGLLVGVELADGRKATSLRGGPPGEGDGPLLLQRGGGGGGGTFDVRYWLWPLPPPETLDLVAQWTARDIPLTRHTLEVAPLLAAAAQSERLWPDEPHDGTASSYSFGAGG
jgi:hypothetical protein